MRSTVVDLQIVFLALSHVVNQRVTKAHHLTSLLDLIRVVLRPIRSITLTMRMHAIDEIVVVIPHPVLLQHGSTDHRGIGLRALRLTAIKAVS